MDLVKLELLKVICPACGQQVEAVARDGRVRGYCAVARKYVCFNIETLPAKADTSFMKDAEYRAKQSANMKRVWQDPDYRAKQLANIKRVWQDPDFRARQRAGIKRKGMET